MDEVTVRQVDVADDDELRDWYAVVHATFAADSPELPFLTHPEVVAQARGRDSSLRFEYWLMRAAGVPVAGYRLIVPLKDNLGTVELLLAVHPEHRHRGHGRALLDRARDRVRTLGRHQVIVELTEPADDSENRAMRFAAAAGARRSLGEVHRVLDLGAVDHDRLARLRSDAEAAARGYELVAWTGPCPDDLVDDYAGLMARMSTDAPMGGLDIELQHWDALRVREREAVLAEQGRTAYGTAARVGPDGPLVAFTDLGTTRHDPDNAFQWNTLVLREHRGHRLGALVKVANLQRFLSERPVARRLHTWNADTNTFMIAINEAMGFVPVARESAWRLDL
jgi:GNAT superfamily N-acetyltransferase